MNTRLTIDPMTMAYHELRSPLGLVAMTARAAADDCSDVLLRRRCEAIERAAERLLRTTQNILSLAAAGVDTTPEAFSPVDDLAAMAADFRELGLPVEFVAERRAQGTHACIARAGFEALVQSLICNALDHGVAGRCLEIHVDVVSNELLVEIRNDVATQQHHAGLGVGVYLCNRLAERLGVLVSSHQDVGSHTAVVAIPVGTSDEECSQDDSVG